MARVPGHQREGQTESTLRQCKWIVMIKKLEENIAHAQLSASASTKNPAYPDNLYIFHQIALKQKIYAHTFCQFIGRWMRINCILLLTFSVFESVLNNTKRTK